MRERAWQRKDTAWSWKDMASEILHLWKRGFAGLFPVLFLVRLAAAGILLPILDDTLKLAIKLSGYSYLNLQNMGSFLCRPSAWVFFLVWFFCFSVLGLLELLLATFYFRQKEQKMEFRLTGMLHFVLFSLRRPWKRGCIRILPVVLLQELLAGNVVLGYMLLKIRMPNNLWSDLKSLLPALAAVLLAVFLLLLLGFRQIFTIPYYLIEGLPAGESIKRGRNLLRHNRLRTLTFYLLLTGGIALLSFLFYLLLMAAVVAGLKLFLPENYVLAKFLAMYDSINLVVGFLIAAFSIYLYQGMVTHLFYRYKDERDELTSGELAYGYLEHNSLKRYAVLTRILAALVFLVSAASAYNIARNGTFQTVEFLPVTGITAHRGQSAEAPENTLPALELAIEQSADYAEIDVRQTADGEIVLMHDLSLKRTCGVSRNLNTVAYEELQLMDAGAWFSPKFRGTRVPTLAEVMELCKGNINLNIELKTAGDAAELAEKVAALIDEYDFENQCIISSTDYQVLLEIKKQKEEIRTGYIMSMVYGNYYDKEGIDFFSIKSGFVTQSTVDRLHETGKEIHVWTVNRKAELQRVRNLGVDNIITDDVILARQICFQDMEGSFFGILRIILRS